MIEAIGHVRAALTANGKRLESMAHDIANSHTSGHRSQRTGFSLGLAAKTSEGPQMDVRTALGPGMVHLTGRDLDVAIGGDGFFVIEGVGGELATRHGEIGVNEDGFLTLDGGLLLGDGGPIERGRGALGISTDGTVAAGGQVLGRLRMVMPQEMERADDQGRWLLVGNEEDVPEAARNIRQGFVEGSNIDITRVAAEMVLTRRHHQLAMQAFKLLDTDVLETSIEHLGRA